MENKKKKKKKKKFFFFFSNWEFFVWNWEKNILFSIGNGAEFRPQNQEIESPKILPAYIYSLTSFAFLEHLNSGFCHTSETNILPF